MFGGFRQASFLANPTSGISVALLVVGGGGAGGSAAGGGGGAGGLVYNSAYILTPGVTYSGFAGGAGAASTSNQGAAGSQSVFDTITAWGGGGGGGNNNQDGAGGTNRGSGGGGVAQFGVAGVGGTSVMGQGNDGASTYVVSGRQYGGGGGGAGAVGQ